MEPKDIVTLAIAAYGAALSTYNLVRARQRDRKQIKVVMNTAMYTFGGSLGPAMLSIDVVNVGHRPALVSAPTLCLEDGRSMALMGADGITDFPKQLTDGGSGTVRIRYSEVARALHSAGYAARTEISPACTDSTGRTFVGKPWKLDVAEWLRT